MDRLEQAADGIKDWSARPRAEAIARRLAFFSTLAPVNRSLLSDMIGIVQAGRKFALLERAPSLMTKLGGESRAAPSLNPERLLRYAGQGGDDFMDDRARFESLSTFDLAVFLMAIEHEPASSRYVVGEDVSEMIELLYDRVFVGKKQEVFVRVTHDPDNLLRVSRVDFDGGSGSGEMSAVHEMVLRSTEDGQRAMIEDGAKELFSAGLKMLRRRIDGHKAWSQIRDRRGLRLTVPREEDVPGMVRRLAQFAASIQAEFYPGKTQRGPNARMNEDNRHSSPDFQALKYILVWRGRTFEVQVQTAAEYYSAAYSLGSESRALYVLRKFADDAALLRPQSFYKIDWQAETHDKEPYGRLYMETIDDIRRRVARATGRY